MDENAGTVTLTVTKTGLTASNAQVTYSTNDDTASGGRDYVPVTGQLLFLPDEDSKSFDIDISQIPGYNLEQGLFR